MGMQMHITIIVIAYIQEYGVLFHCLFTLSYHILDMFMHRASTVVHKFHTTNPGIHRIYHSFYIYIPPLIIYFSIQSSNQMLRTWLIGIYICIYTISQPTEYSSAGSGDRIF